MLKISSQAHVGGSDIFIFTMLVNEAAVFLQLPPAARLSSSRLIFDGADGGMAAMMQKT